ncbi:MULE domain-containing protein [Abeliophyllum distichum]|uniref:MULE domain-containing protein n=1 Tax=Abeliophyllum distichum TaxID=126358 RepID=A0ABD1VQL4_9LAMI
MANTAVAEECLLEEEDKDDASGCANNDIDIEEDELDVSGLHFSDSKDDVNDSGFIFDKNMLERMAVGLNSDPAVDEAHITVAEEGVESDESYSPLSEELHTNYSSGEENNYRFPNLVPEKELFDPKFEFGKTFMDMELFRKTVRNHGVVIQCNFRFRPNDDRRAQVSFGGQMLSAVALDANDSIYLVAFAIVEKETTVSWRWFVRHLGDNLGIVNNKWTFISDRQKGLQNVIEEMYPEAEHRFLWEAYVYEFL